MSSTNQDRLSRLKALQHPAAPARQLANFVPMEVPGLSAEIPAGAARLAAMLGATPSRNQFGEHLLLRRWFAELIGCEAPGVHLDPTALRLLAPDAPVSVADPEQWLFLDIETTGIVGGTGTYPFLIGIAWWDAGGLEIEQFFMREHSEEHSVLVALAARMAQRPVLVTFNGKTFDWPLLETRYLMTRKISVPRSHAHLDFLHPARNLWRLRHGSARLQDLEKNVLGWDRGPDILSQLIPQIYFDYLHGGSPDALVSIFRHNQMDLLGLASLSVRTLAVLGNPEEQGRDGFELFGASRICERRGDTVRARVLYERSIACELPPETERAAQKFLARLAKRHGDHVLASELWEKMLGASRDGFEAYEQLAIHLERQAKEPQLAASLARKALTELHRANRLGLITSVAYRRSCARFKQRIARLDRRNNQSLRQRVFSAQVQRESKKSGSQEESTELAD